MLVDLRLVGFGTGLNVYDVTADEERLRITSSGNIGINNTSPQYLLHLKSNSTASSKRIDMHMTNDTTGHNADDGVQFGYQDVYGAYIWNFENTPIYFGTNNTRTSFYYNFWWWSVNRRAHHSMIVVTHQI